MQELAEPFRIGCDFGQHGQRPLVDLERVALHTVGDDAVPFGALTDSPLAQHLRVIDLADLEVRASAQRPDFADAALRDEILGGPAQ